MNGEAPSALWRGGTLLLPPPALPPGQCPLGPVTLYQEVAAAASLALVCMSFPLVPRATFFSGCLGNQPLLLEDEEGPKSGKKKKMVASICWQIFGGCPQEHLFPFFERRSLGISPLAPSTATVTPISGGRESLRNRQDWPCCNIHTPTQSHSLLCLHREGKKRPGHEQATQRPTHGLFVRKLKICLSDVWDHAFTRQLANGRDWNDGIDQII